MPKSICSIEECERPSRRRGWCSMHHQRWKKHGDPTFTKHRQGCTIPNCKGEHAAHGLCQTHYGRQWKHGNPLHSDRPTFKMTVNQAFRHYMPGSPPPAPSSVEGCWIWQGPTETLGYGAFRSEGRVHKAHRISYERFVGPIPDGLLLRHTCDVRNCIQPAHLIPGTDAENNRDMMERGRNRQQRGSKNGSSKLTEAQVRLIRLEYATNRISQQALADRFGVTQTCISSVVRRQWWAHVS